MNNARGDLLARLHREGSVRDIQYEEGFTCVTATIPTRSLETFAPFLPVPEPVLAEEVVPSAD